VTPAAPVFLVTVPRPPAFPTRPTCRDPRLPAPALVAVLQGNRRDLRWVAVAEVAIRGRVGWVFAALDDEPGAVIVWRAVPPGAFEAVVVRGASRQVVEDVRALAAMLDGVAAGRLQVISTVDEAGRLAVVTA